MSDTTADAGRHCPWCATSARETDTQCPACGAKLVQEAGAGELVIPGVTHVDQGLEHYARQPLRIPGAYPTHALPGAAIEAVLGGGPLGMLALAGLGAAAATKHLASARADAPKVTTAPLVEQPNTAVADLLEQLKEQERAAGLSLPEPDKPDDSAAPGN